MRVVLTIIAALVGSLLGAAIGFGIAMAVSKPRYDGTFGMREVLICVPASGLIGLAAGIWWGVTTRLVA